jgi:TolB-like protein
MGAESAEPASTPTGAVFLSYASQDAAAAQKICDALQAARIEVWFDKSALRGGDVWDRQIREQIHTCRLFIPIISANTEARDEGYFRREWGFATDRTRDIAEKRAFLIPVVIDDTPERGASVPDKFHQIQWTRLPRGETPPAFVARVAALLGASAPVAPADRPAAAPLSAPPAHTRNRRNLSIALGLVALAVIFAGGWFALQRSGSHGHADSAVAPKSQPAIPEKSIAVLPFVDLSAKKDQEYFSDGLSEELIDLLAKVPDLRVPARTSSFFFKGKSEDIAAIAQKLRVANVLEGSVRKDANTIRVTAQLIRADSGYHLWSETCDRDLKDVFKVQDEIAGAVVSALKLKLASGPQVPSSRRTPVPEAYNQYLLGRQFYDRKNEEGYRRAVAAFRKAVELDPSYAAAYAELALAESFADQTDDPEVVQHALALADKAVELAPDEADGYGVRGYLRLTGRRDWAGARADLEKALALDSRSSEVQQLYAELLDAMGRLPQAIAAAKTAT